MPRRPRRHLVPLLAASLALGTAPAAAAQAEAAAEERGEPVLIIDAQLRASTARLVGLDRGKLVLLDSTGRRVHARAESVLGIIALEGPIDAGDGVGAATPSAERRALNATRLARRLAAEETGVLELADGQRLPGTIAPTGATEEALVWMHPILGAVDAPLERVVRAVFPQARRSALPLPRRAVAGDALVLVNGDRLEGFILRIGMTARIELEDGTEQEIPSERVAAALVDNPPSPLEGLVVWLDDGTILSVEDVQTRPADDGAPPLVLVAPPGSEPATYDRAALRALAFDASRLVPLSALEPEATAAIDLPFAEPIRREKHPDDYSLGTASLLNAMDVVLPAPMRVVYELPADSTRLATTVHLAETGGGWGACELVVSAGGEELDRVRLHAEAPVAALNVELAPADAAPPRRLELTLEPGRYGPIRDRVVLRRPLLRIGR